MVSELFDPDAWRAVEGFDLTDVTYHRSVDHGTVRIAFNRPEIRNAFRPHTVDELYRVLDHARMCSDVGCVLLTGNGPSPKDGGWAFCSGGDQRIRGRDGYRYAEEETAETIDPALRRGPPYARTRLARTPFATGSPCRDRSPARGPYQ
ncbi:MAG: enoyl-CoA hydratase-related protein, partial [Actinoallomurus sp.]